MATPLRPTYRNEYLTDGEYPLSATELMTLPLLTERCSRIAIGILTTSGPSMPDRFGGNASLAGDALVE